VTRLEGLPADLMFLISQRVSHYWSTINPSLSIGEVPVDVAVICHSPTVSFKNER
jgi:hypothetical protein